MTEVFRPGEKVIAHYTPLADQRWLSGWYNDVILQAEHDGNYLVRWEDRSKIKLPGSSSVDPDEIKRRPDRGNFSGF